MRSLEDEYDERITRLLALANSAQDAADRAMSVELRETYLRLAGQWADLATMAEKISTTLPHVASRAASRSLD
ncbi:MAG TPA: hypothetical protein VGL35_13090 [Rhizomicrobium sp.]|jgi:hypothetical protein